MFSMIALLISKAVNGYSVRKQMVSAMWKCQAVDLGLDSPWTPYLIGRPKSKETSRKQEPERKVSAHQVNVTVMMEELLKTVADVFVLDLHLVILRMRTRTMTQNYPANQQNSYTVGSGCHNCRKCRGRSRMPGMVQFISFYCCPPVLP